MIEKIKFWFWGFKWSIKRWYHFYFGKLPFKIQIGDFVITDYEIKKLEVISLFKEQIKLTLLKGKYSPEKDFSIIENPHIPSSRGPLGQRSIVAWKGNVMVHTKKSWEKYIGNLIENQIEFKKSKIGGI